MLYSNTSAIISFYTIWSFERNHFPYFQDFSFSTRYISSDVPTMQIVDTSEKAFYSNSERRNMAADSDRVVFRNQRIWLGIYRANACDSFIYKHPADVIRISFNTLHLLFTSCTPASWKPMSECVSGRVPFRFVYL